MKRAGHLFERVTAFGNLLAAFHDAAREDGFGRPSVQLVLHRRRAAVEGENIHGRAMVEEPPAGVRTARLDLSIGWATNFLLPQSPDSAQKANETDAALCWPPRMSVRRCWKPQFRWLSSDLNDEMAISDCSGWKFGCSVDRSAEHQETNHF